MNRLSELFAADRALSQLISTPEQEPAECLLQPRSDAPVFSGKSCTVCERKFKAASEFLLCRLCDEPVCRRESSRGSCKHVHQAKHRVDIMRAARKEQAC